MWFGREGSHGVCMVVDSCCVFQTMTANAYIFISLFHNNLFHDHVNSFSSKKKKRRKREEKKTIKKLVKHLKF